VISVATPVIGERELTYITDAVRSGWVSSQGPYIERFERAFADYIGVSDAVAVSNGTVALHLALHALGIKAGDEVLVPDLTFVATVHAVLQTGATPVFVDVEPDTWCIDPIAAARAITPRTRAIIPVHLYGHPADMDAIQGVADKGSLVIVEDAAEAHGAQWRGRRVGSIGKVGVFSFYGNKIITTGEGGMVTSNDTTFASRLRYLKNHGMSPQRRYYHTELAFNYRMTNIQAALGLAQLEQIDHFIEQKRKIYRWYAEGLAGVRGIVLNSERQYARNVYWMSSLVLGEDCPIARQELADFLALRGIDSRPFFVPLHQLPHLAGFRAIGRNGEGCPEATKLGAMGLNLPSDCHLSEREVREIASAINQIVSGHANEHVPLG